MEKFFEAISSGTAEKVKLMLTLGQDPNVKNSDGFSPLNVAIKTQNPELVEMLVSAGADVNAVEVDSEGYAPYPRPLLHFAITHSSGETSTVNLLISAGANVNAVDEYGITPLHMAADENPRITSILISAGANVNAVDNKGNSVLHEAVLCGNRNGGNAEIINMLVSAGANVNATNKEGKTALELMS